MNWGAFDLNLLIVFDAVMQERGVTRAGQRIGLSQPAMSHALARLRHMLKDDLFIRAPDGMVPTPRAEALAQPLRAALNEMQFALEPAVFDPAAADRRFVVAVNNDAAIVLAPLLLTAALAAAPLVRLHLRPSENLNILDGLDRGDLDLALCSLDSPGERFATTALIEDRFVMMMRRGHPAGRGELCAKAFADLPHLEISPSGEETGCVDSWLGEHGLVRRIAQRTPCLSAASTLVQSDMIAILSHRVALELARNHPLEIRELPWDTPPARTNMLWHRRLDQHPAHEWLRGVVLSVSETLSD